MNPEKKKKMMQEMMPKMMEDMKPEDMMEMMHEVMPQMMGKMDPKKMMEGMHDMMPKMMENCMTSMSKEERKEMLNFCSTMIEEMKEKFVGK